MNCHTYRRAVISKSPTEPRLERHRRSCPACSEFSARSEAAQRLLAEPAANEKDRVPGSGFAAGVIAALPALPPPPGPLTWAAVRLLPAACALAVTLLGWCWVATPTPSELWTQAGEDELLTWVLDEDGDGG